MAERDTGGGIRCEVVYPTLCVGDLTSALAYYVDTLGFRESWRWGDPPTHAAVTLGDVEVHLSAREAQPGGGWLYFVIDDVDALHARYEAAGVEIVDAPKDEPWDMREMAVRDLTGNDLTFATPVVARTPALPIRRDEVQVRLERRLLAVARDVARHKGMSLGEMLEETLLHTYEALPGGGVASPHDRGTLDRIEEFKDVHGLDYDTHASYRFVEEPASPSVEGETQ